MRHAFIDNYAGLSSPLHRLNTKVKIISLIIFLLIIILTPIKYILFFYLYGLIIIILMRLSKIPFSFLLKRAIHLFPFIVIISLTALFQEKGTILFFNCFVKAVLASLSVLIISSTTRFNLLLGALEELKTPRIFISLLSFLYRYSFLLEDQSLKTRLAYISRNINNKNRFVNVRILSNILATLFVRTYERAERVYLAMCARGFNDEENN